MMQSYVLLFYLQIRLKVPFGFCKPWSFSARSLPVARKDSLCLLSLPSLWGRGRVEKSEWGVAALFQRPDPLLLNHRLCSTVAHTQQPVLTNGGVCSRLRQQVRPEPRKALVPWASFATSSVSKFLCQMAIIILILLSRTYRISLIPNGIMMIIMILSGSGIDWSLSLNQTHDTVLYSSARQIPYDMCFSSLWPVAAHHVGLINTWPALYPVQWEEFTGWTWMNLNALTMSNCYQSFKVHTLISGLITDR